MGSLYSLLVGPQLYRNFERHDREVNIIEKWGDSSMSIARGLFNFTTSLAFGPVIIFYLYQRGSLNTDTFLFVLKYMCILLILSYGGRFVGRLMDPAYREFVALWEKARDSASSSRNEALKKYDFELIGVNADFHAVPNPNLWYHEAIVPDANPLTKALAWYAVHAFGRHMMYPGSLGLLNWMLGSNLQEARKTLVRQRQAKRAWIRTTEGDLLDSMFVRGVGERTQTLVLCSEGNAGYYEIGVTNTPLQLGYSVLGWNHPGFGESSGLPFPKNTLAAADAVMQYAKSLGFNEENIVIFGWSIGGFPSSFLAANYPNVKAVVLDATFDDMRPLAESRMPQMLSGIVEYAIRAHANLEVHALLTKYKGPLRLIRRLQEEILTTDEGRGEAHTRSTNRANFLLKKVLEARHPEVVKGLEPQIDIWLAMTPQERALSTASDSEDGRRRAKLFAACEHYMVDFDATHVAPLDPLYFNVPEPIRLH